MKGDEESMRRAKERRWTVCFTLRLIGTDAKRTGTLRKRNRDETQGGRKERGRGTEREVSLHCERMRGHAKGIGRTTEEEEEEREPGGEI